MEGLVVRADEGGFLCGRAKVVRPGFSQVGPGLGRAMASFRTDSGLAAALKRRIRSFRRLTGVSQPVSGQASDSHAGQRPVGGADRG